MTVPKFGYHIRSARIEELPLLAHIEGAAAVLFLDTPYAFLVDAEPLPLEFVRAQFRSGLVWVELNDSALPSTVPLLRGHVQSITGR